MLHLYMYKYTIYTLGGIHSVSTIVYFDRLSGGTFVCDVTRNRRSILLQSVVLSVCEWGGRGFGGGGRTRDGRQTIIF